MATPSIKSGFPVRAGGTFSDTVSRSVTLAAGNAVAVLAFLDRSGTSFTGVTCGGVAMTAAAVQTNSYTGKVQGFYLSAASITAGTQNIVATCDNSNAKPQILVVVLEDTGGGNVTLSNVASTYTGSNISQSITITSATGELAVALVQDDSSATPTGTNGTTVAYYDTALAAVGVWTKAGAASVTLSTTYGAPAPSVAKFGFSAASAGGGGGTSTVSSDLAASYSVVGRVQSDLAASYTVTNAGTFTSEPLRQNDGTLLANATLPYVALYRASSPRTLVVEKTSVTTNSSGVFSVTDDLIVAGTTYAVDFARPDGVSRMPRKAAV